MSGAPEQKSAIARYRVLRELGRRSQRSYAAVRMDGSNAVVVLNRFMREARVREERVSSEAMVALQRDALCLEKNWHPNISRVRHVDVVDSMLFIASDLLDGITLEDLLTESRARGNRPLLSEDVLARIFLDVLSGLAALHSLREDMYTPLAAFHGELSPSNVVIGKDGVARIIDVFRPRPVTIAAASEALGYASPESLAGEVEQDARVDVYAAGVMLWEALMERHLYEDTQPARIAQRQREDEVPRPAGGLGAVAMKALSFDPLLRFKTAQDMASSLRAAAANVAPGGVVAQIVIDLAGEKIRQRRAELVPHASGQRPAAQAAPLTPRSSRSGSYSRAEGISVPQTPTEPAPPPPSGQAPSRKDDVFPSFEKLPSILHVGDVTPLVPPVNDERRPIASPKKAPHERTRNLMAGRVRRVTPRDLRAVTPAEIAEAERALAAKAEGPPTDIEGPFVAHVVAPSSSQSPIGSPPLHVHPPPEVDDADVLESGDLLPPLHDESSPALEAARHVLISHQSISPEPQPAAENVEEAPPPSRTMPVPGAPPSFSSIDQLTSSLGAPPPSSEPQPQRPGLHWPSPTFHHVPITPTSVTPIGEAVLIEREVAAADRQRRVFLIVVVAIAIVAFATLLTGASIISRRGAAAAAPVTKPIATQVPPVAATTTTPPKNTQPPSTVIVAPPVTTPSPAASATTPPPEKFEP